MNDKSDNISAEELNAFLDGELTTARRDVVAAAIATDPGLASRVSEFRHINERLQRRYDAVLSAPVPARLLRPLSNRTRFLPLRIAAVVAWFTLGGVIGAFVSSQLSTAPPALRPLAVEAAFAHTIYVREKRHAVEVVAADKDHLNAWLSMRLQRPVEAPDIRDVGFTLIGGRLLPDAGRAAAQFMYEDDDANRFTLYVRQVANTAPHSAFAHTENGGVGVVYWEEGGLAYAFSGQLPKPELITIAEHIRQTLNR